MRVRSDGGMRVEVDGVRRMERSDLMKGRQDGAGVGRWQKGHSAEVAIFVGEGGRGLVINKWGDRDVQ